MKKLTTVLFAVLTVVSLFVSCSADIKVNGNEDNRNGEAQSPSFADRKTYAVGEKGPAGGIVFYDAGETKTYEYFDEFGNRVSRYWRYLEAAPSDLGDYAFGYYRPDGGEAREVGTGINLGEGRKNTSSIVNAVNDNVTYSTLEGNEKKEYAARVCYDFKYTNSETAVTYDDWFLPSFEEFTKLYEHKDLCGLGRGCYWTSSEDGHELAYYFSEDDPNPENGYREYEFAVRPIRAFY